MENCTTMTTDNGKILDYLKNSKVRKLHIGCGPNLLPGWLNTDNSIRENNKDNVVFLDAGKPFPIPNQTFDYVFSEHLFEHLTYRQANTMLKGCFQILKPGGILRIATPNLEFLVDLYLNPQKDINKSYVEFDSRRSGLPSLPAFSISYFHTAWGHQIIYDKESLTMMLESAGFKNVHRCEIGKSEHADLCAIEGHRKHFESHQADKDYNALQTMVFEAQR